MILISKLLTFLGFLFLLGGMVRVMETKGYPPLSGPLSVFTATVLFFFGAIFSANADDQFPQCVTPLGKHVAVEYATSEGMAEADAAWGFAATYYHDNGHVDRWIILDELILDAPREFALWVHAHECAHHWLNHGERYAEAEALGNYELTRQMELEADVFASKRYKLLYGERSLRIALELLAVSISDDGTSTHPKVQERLDNIHQALGLTSIHN